MANYYGTPAIVTDGLVFAVDAGNGQSYVSGSSDTFSLVSSDTGSLVNGVDFNPANQGTWDFDGVNDTIRVEDSAALEIEAVTMQCWFNFGSGAWQPYASIFGRTGGGSSPYKIRTYGGTGTDIGLQIYDSTWRQGPKLTTAGGDLSYNTWYFLSFSYDYNASDGQRMKVYVNGVLNSQSTTGGSAITTSSSETLEFMESAFDTNANMFGYLGPCVIYNRELTAAEVLQNYNATKNRFI